MLFDLRGRGRRNTIKVIYVALAFLMGGGLILFGIGGATNGGLVDAITGSDGGSDSGSGRYEDQIKAAQAKLAANANDRGAYEELISAKIQLAGFDNHYDPNTDSYDEQGLALLREATQEWNKYQALDVAVDDQYGVTANRIATAFIYLQQPEEYVKAQEIVAEARNATGPYQQLASAYYQLGKVRPGDLAAAKAVELAAEDQKATVKSDMEAAKAAAPVDTSTQPVPTPAETATATAEPKEETTSKKKAAAKKRAAEKAKDQEK